MNSRARAFLAGLMLSSLTSCGRDGASRRDREPVAHCVELEKDLGEIELADQPRSVAFLIENRGDAALRIERTVSSCGCTDVTISRDVIPPSEAGIVSASIFPRQSEERAAAIRVYTNDPRLPFVPLKLEWKAVAPIDLSPVLVDFGNVDPDSQAQAIVLVRDRHRVRNGGCDIRRIECFPDRELTATLSDWNDDAQDGRSRTLEVRLDPLAERDTRRGRIVLHLDGCWTSEITLPVIWLARPPIESRPERVFFGIAAPGTVQDRKLDLVFASGDTVIDSVEVVGGDENLRCRIGERTEKGTRIHLTWTIPHASGLLARTVRIRCSGAQAREIDVPVSAYARQE